MLQITSDATNVKINDEEEPHPLDKIRESELSQPQESQPNNNDSQSEQKE